MRKAWRVYGANGHRQRVSFQESAVYDFSVGDKKRIVEVVNADKTGTHDYTLVIIERNTAQECEDEFWGQVSDGIFENARVGEIEEVSI